MSTPQNQQAIRLEAATTKLIQSGAIEATKAIIHKSLYNGEDLQSILSTDMIEFREKALSDEKTHFAIHLMKSFLMSLGCERTWKTFLLEMNMEDDTNDWNHSEHFHWLTHDVKPLLKQIDPFNGEVPEAEQTPEPYTFPDQYPNGALYSFISDAWATRQELINKTNQESYTKFKEVPEDQRDEFTSFINKIKTKSINNTPNKPTQQQSKPTTTTTTTQQSSTTQSTLPQTTPVQRKTTSTSTTSSTSTSQPNLTRTNSGTTRSPHHSPASRPLNGGAITSDLPSTSTLGTEFALPPSTAINSNTTSTSTTYTPQFRPSSRPSSPARLTTANNTTATTKTIPK